LDRGHLSKITFEINSDETSSTQSESASVLDLARILNLPTPVRQARMSPPPCSPVSYRKYLQSRGSEVLQLTCSPKQTGDISTRYASPFGPEALQQPTASSRAVPLTLGWNADSSSCSTSTPTSHCAMHISSPSLSDCCQSGQIQAVSLAHPGPMPVASDACQTQPLMNHSVSQQLYASNQQYSLQRVCEPSSCFIGHNMPVISNVTKQVLARAVTMPNLWSMCDSSPHSLDGTRPVHSERDLMAIAMPDAFSLSNAEIVSQLKSAVPFTYED